MRVEAVRPECNKGGVCAASNPQCVCVLACMRCPRLLSLIDPAQHPSDLQDVSELADAAGGGEMAREMTGKKGREESKIK